MIMLTVTVLCKAHISTNEMEKAAPFLSAPPCHGFKQNHRFHVLQMATIFNFNANDIDDRSLYLVFWMCDTPLQLFHQGRWM